MRTTREEWSEEALETLDIVRRKAAASQRRRVSIFDFDNTCVRGDCGALIHCHISRTFRWNFERGILPQLTDALGRSRIERLLAAHRDADDSAASLHATDQPLSSVASQLYGELVFIFPRHMRLFGPSETYAWATGLYAGLSVGELRELAREMIRHEGNAEFHNEEIKAVTAEESPLFIQHGLRERPAFRELIEALDDWGVVTSIVSASNEWTVEESSRWTGVPRARVYGNRAETVDEAITSTVRRPVSWGPGKVTIAKQISDAPPLLAIGDSRTDRELLDYAEHAILIDCGDEGLASYAKERGWAITPSSGLRDAPLTVD